MISSCNKSSEVHDGKTRTSLSELFDEQEPPTPRNSDYRGSGWDANTWNSRETAPQIELAALVMRHCERKHPEAKTIGHYGDFRVDLLARRRCYTRPGKRGREHGEGRKACVEGGASCQDVAATAAAEETTARILSSSRDRHRDLPGPGPRI